MSDLRKLHEEATPGPWRNQGRSPYRLWASWDHYTVRFDDPNDPERGPIVSVHGEENAENAALIAATRNALPYICDLIEAKEKWGYRSEQVYAAWAALDAHLNPERAESKGSPTAVSRLARSG